MTKAVIKGSLKAKVVGATSMGAKAKNGKRKTPASKGATTAAKSARFTRTAVDRQPAAKAKSPVKPAAKLAAKPATKLAAKSTKAVAKHPKKVAAKTGTGPVAIPKPKAASKTVRPITLPHTRTLPAPKPTRPDQPQIGASRGKTMAKTSGIDLGSIKLSDSYRPSDDEPFMSPKHRAYFRQKLIKWKDDIIKETQETLQVLHDDTIQHPDLADRATHESERAQELRVRDRQRKLIAKIDEALRRIDDGSYGYCEETGEPIALKRLDARPVATLSLEAQERHERRERVYRDE
jgi:DnaK suppressor protein